jgi:hypothetical protein
MLIVLMLLLASFLLFLDLVGMIAFLVKLTNLLVLI